jgi:capsular exopolysaccharide synthesis family protein
VIVVDSDLRRPSQHKNFDLSNKFGLSTVLAGKKDLETAIQKSRHFGLKVLTSGPLPPDPAELLASSQMKTVINNLALQYDLVILDAPALLAVTDASLLATIVDGVLLVARRNNTREKALRETCKQLADHKARLIGLVVNEAEANGSYYYYRGKNNHNR